MAATWCVVVLVGIVDVWALAAVVCVLDAVSAMARTVGSGSEVRKHRMPPKAMYITSKAGITPGLSTGRQHGRETLLRRLE